MIIAIDLNKEQTEIIRALHGMMKDPDVMSIDDYASILFVDLLQRIWDGVRNKTMN